MLDIEALGNTPGSVITSIGACEFNMRGVTSTFYRRIDVETCVDAGLHMDVATVLWWLEQGDAARKELTNPDCLPLEGALREFSEWVNMPDGSGVACMWGNGAAFDNVLLRSAYEATGITPPWSFRNDRCYRTMMSVAPHVEMQREGVHHNALNDAVSQAKHLIRIYQTLLVSL